MKITQNNKLKMIQATGSCLTKTPAGIITKRPVITLLTGKVNTLIDSILKADKTQTTIAVGVGSEKHLQKSLLNINVSSAGRNLLSFATSTNNAELATLMEKTLKRLDQQNDNTFVQRCRTIHGKALEFVASLAPFGITNALLTALLAQIDSYAVMAENFRNKVSEQVNATTMIADLLKEATRLFRKEVDPVIYSLTDEAEYVAEYKHNREIINLGHHFTQFKGKSISKETGLELKFVEIEIISKDGELKLKTDLDGKYKVRLDPDTYTLKALHPDYQPFIIEDVKIQPGEIKVENFELVPKV